MMSHDTNLRSWSITSRWQPQISLSSVYIHKDYVRVFVLIHIIIGHSPAGFKCRNTDLCKYLKHMFSIWINNVRDRSGGGGGGGGRWYFCLNWGRPQTEKYVTRGKPNFLILSYSFSISRLYRIPQNISPFLVPIIVVSIVYYVYAVHHKSRIK
jgi:hypothetical protein